MGVLVCPISRKHFLRVVSEWISDFGTISLGFLTLSPNSHLKWNCHYSFKGLAYAGPRGKTLSMRNWALIHFGIFSHKMQNISIKTWECWERLHVIQCQSLIFCLQISVLHLWLPLGNSSHFYLGRETRKMEEISFIKEKVCESFIVQNMTCYLTVLLLSYQVRSPNENLIE